MFSAVSLNNALHSYALHSSMKKKSNILEGGGGVEKWEHKADTKNIVRKTTNSVLCLLKL